MPRCAAWLAAVVLAGLGLAAGESPAPAESEELVFRRKLAEGATFLEQATKSSRARALGCFKTALKMRPESAEAYYWIGLTYADLANHDFAARHAEKATLCDRNLAKAWLLWGQSLMVLRQWDEAKAKLDKANELAPGDPLASFDLARCYYHGYNNMNDALYLFKETVRRIGEPRRAARLREVYVQAKLYQGC
jgi:tetratricopeptide (TPR) repeat protein